MLVISKEGQKPVRISNDRAPDVCIMLCGGGYSPHQTARAMAAYGELKARGATAIGDITLAFDDEDKGACPPFGKPLFGE